MTNQIADWGTSQRWKRGDLRMLVAELERQRDSQVDFVADQRTMRIKEDSEGRLCLEASDAQTGEWLTMPMPFTDDALNQFAERQNPPIPRKYFRDALKIHPVNTRGYVNLNMQDSPRRNFVRCLDNHVRAFLSDSYRAIDNYDIAFPILEAVQENGGQVFECTLTDRNMRIKFINDEIFEEIATVREDKRQSWYAGGLGNQEHLRKVSARSVDSLPGGPDAVYPLVTASNSEIGFGRFTVHLGILQGICFNLATVEESVAQVHLGSKMETGIFSADTVEKETAAIVAKAKDIIHAAFDVRIFKGLCDRLRESSETPISAPSSAVGNLIANTDKLLETDKDSILAYFIEDYKPTVYGLAQAVSRVAQDVEDPDRAFELESMAGDMMLKPSSVLDKVV